MDLSETFFDQSMDVYVGPPSNRDGIWGLCSVCSVISPMSSSLLLPQFSMDLSETSFDEFMDIHVGLHQIETEFGVYALFAL